MTWPLLQPLQLHGLGLTKEHMRYCDWLPDHTTLPCSPSQRAITLDYGCSLILHINIACYRGGVVAVLHFSWLENRIFQLFVYQYKFHQTIVIFGFNFWFWWLVYLVYSIIEGFNIDWIPWQLDDYISCFFIVEANGLFLASRFKIINK